MYLIPATCELWIDGVRYADGRPGEDDREPFALSDLTIRWGRDNTVDQPSPASCSFSIMDPPGGSVRFDATVALGSTVVVWTELNGQRAVVFGGRVTDLQASFDAGAGSGVCDVIAADQLSDLANRFVGSEPWAAELLWQRAVHILTAVGLDANSVLAPIPSGPANLTVSRLDVDRQAAAGLLVELATTGGLVLWASWRDNHAYLVFEDPALRASLYVFAEDPATLLWRPVPGSGAGTPVSACQVLQDPVKWARVVGDLITRVTVRWLDQSTTPGTTERSYGIVDSGSETVYGARGMSIGTTLTREQDASALATRTLAGHQPSPSWRTEGLTWDLSASETDDDPTRALVLALLGDTTRVGYAIALTDLPYWTPTSAAVQLYIEGGTYRFTDGGHWELALEGSPATGLGGSLTCAATNRSVRYKDVDPAVSYLDMIGVGPAGLTGQSWDSVPAATTWDTVPAGTKWSDPI